MPSSGVTHATRYTALRHPFEKRHPSKMSLNRIWHQCCPLLTTDCEGWVWQFADGLSVKTGYWPDNCWGIIVSCFRRGENNCLLAILQLQAIAKQ